MSKSYEIQGEIHSIGDTTEYGNNGFTKREFVIKLTGEGENPAYPNYIPLELIKDKCALMDAYQVGSEIIAHFNFSGRLWTGKDGVEKCFSSHQAWRIEAVGNAPAPEAFAGNPAYDQTPPPEFDDDIPF